LRASRLSNGTARSNIRWPDGATTVPRHHRDIYVSEYGVAATRGRTDAQVIEAMLQIADSAFQPALMAEAKRARKLPSNYALPGDAAGNTPQVLQDIFRRPEWRSFFPEYPLGTDLTAIEQQLVPALDWLKTAMSRTPTRIRVISGALLALGITRNTEAIDRLGLSGASGIGNRLLRRLVNYALDRTKNGK
jgi:Acetyl-CoA hydrolase/transferase C-terminal domain